MTVELLEPPSLELTWTDPVPLYQAGTGGPPGAPPEAGVYRIHCGLVSGEGPTVRYIGRSTNLKNRINSHRSASASTNDSLINNGFWDEASDPHVQWAVTEEHYYAEAALLFIYKMENGEALPTFNTVG